MGASTLELTPQPDWETRVNLAEENRRKFQEHKELENEKTTRANFEKRHDLLGTEKSTRDKDRELMETKIQEARELRAAEERARAEQMQQMLRDQRER